MSGRPLSLPVHGAIEFLAGLVMMLTPAALSFSAPALIVTAVLGAILTGSALGLASQTPRSAASHNHFDSVFALASSVAALALAVSGQLAAVILLSAVVVLHAGLSFSTRYAAA